jgi:acetyl-CoA acetyltransferase
MTDTYIYDHVRTPRGKGRPDGSLHEVTPVWLASRPLVALRERNQLDTAAVEDVAMGCVGPVGEQGGNIARMAVLAPITTRACRRSRSIAPAARAWKRWPLPRPR